MHMHICHAHIFFFCGTHVQLPLLYYGFYNCHLNQIISQWIRIYICYLSVYVWLARQKRFSTVICRIASLRCHGFRQWKILCRVVMFVQSLMKCLIVSLCHHDQDIALSTDLQFNSYASSWFNLPVIFTFHVLLLIHYTLTLRYIIDCSVASKALRCCPNNKVCPCPKQGIFSTW